MDANFDRYILECEKQGANIAETLTESRKSVIVGILFANWKTEPRGGDYIVRLKVKEWHPEAEVIIFTAYATAKTVRLADSYNVCKYVNKPIDIEDLIQDITSALELHGSSNFIAISESIWAIVADALKVARTPATILLLGETGTGKDESEKT